MVLRETHRDAPRPPATGPATLEGALAEATAALRAAGVASPRADAEQLAADVLGVGRGTVAARAMSGDPAALAAADLVALRAAVARRARREPLQHIVGTVGFRHLVLQVGPGVFVPRPETEAVVGWAIDEVRARGPARPLCVDLCTGSGAIALSLAQELPAAAVHAVEADDAALGWARRNVAARGLPVILHHAFAGPAPAGPAGPVSPPSPAERPGTVATTTAQTALADLAGRVDLVIANPPYLHDGDRGRLEPEVRDHDPALALWGGDDGLDGLRAVAATAAVLLRVGGMLVVEHDDADGEAAPALLAASGAWTRIADHTDLAGRDRFVTARLGAANGGLR
jgi:release factor glutamine methyltransferase